LTKPLLVGKGGSNRGGVLMWVDAGGSKEREIRGTKLSTGGASTIRGGLKQFKAGTSLIED